MGMLLAAGYHMRSIVCIVFVVDSFLSLAVKYIRLLHSDCDCQGRRLCILAGTSGDRMEMEADLLSNYPNNNVHSRSASHTFCLTGTHNMEPKY